MATDESSSSGPAKLEVPNWLGYLVGVGVAGGLAYLAYSHAEQRRRQEELEFRLFLQSLALKRLEKTATEKSRVLPRNFEARIVKRVDEQLGQRLAAADAQFQRRLDQISDSAASAVEQVLREGTRRSDEIIRKAEERLDHIGWLDEQVSPRTSAERPQPRSDKDAVWTELDDFQRLFES